MACTTVSDFIWEPPSCSSCISCSRCQLFIRWASPSRGFTPQQRSSLRSSTSFKASPYSQKYLPGHGQGYRRHLSTKTWISLRSIPYCWSLRHLHVLFPRANDPRDQIPPLVGVDSNRRPEEERSDVERAWQREGKAMQGERHDKSKQQGRGGGINSNWNSRSEGQTSKGTLTGPDWASWVLILRDKGRSKTTR